MQRRLVIQLAILEAYALILASLQSMGGVRTDEAKYMLNIAYPHPPLGRWLYHLFEFLPFQEMFWRIVLASALVHAFWLVWDRARDLRFPSRVAVGGAWLLSGGVLLQGGTIMLSVLVALEAIVLVWLLGRPSIVRAYRPMLVLFWLAMLFTSYQGFLFFPLVWMLLRKAGSSRLLTAASVGVPMLLLSLYTLSSPQILATMILHTDEGAAQSVTQQLIGVGSLWLRAGAGVISVAGLMGLLLAPSIALLGSLALVSAYVFFSIPYPFYTILFTPLLVEGVHSLLKRRYHPPAFPLLAAMGAAALVVFALFRPPTEPGPARAVVQAINAKHHAGPLVIHGSFGHEWQFESTAPVQKYSEQALAQQGSVLVCLDECPRGLTQGRTVMHVGEVQVYLR